MPDRRGPYDVPERIERLSRALDRVAAGQPAPVLDDAELQELIDLAGQVREALPADLPDPGFRTELKAHLAAGTWANQRKPIALRPRATRAAFPYRTAVGAIAAVLVAAIAVGSLAIWTNTNDPDDARNTAGARQTIDAAPTLAVAFATSTSVDATSVAMSTTAPLESSPADTAEPNLTSTTPASDPTPTTQRTSTSGATATVSIGQPTTSTSVATATTSIESTPSPTESRQLAGVPPVDAEHLECGPCPAADGGGEAPGTAVAVTLDTSLPDLASSALLYTLTPPDVDPNVLVAGVAEKLGIDGPVVRATDARNNVEYRADGSNGATFVWTPENGSFSFTVSDLGDETPEQPELTAETVVDNTRAWLAGIGYPVDSLTATPLAEEGADGSWSIQIWTADVPYNSFGHPLGVIVTVNAAGQITGGTGFWLTLHSEEDVSILSADEAWEAIAALEGYWTGGGIAAGGGEYAIDTLFLGYTLTRADGEDELIYQPTIIAQGEFTTPNGDATRLTVYLQATK